MHPLPTPASLNTDEPTAKADARARRRDVAIPRERRNIRSVAPATTTADSPDPRTIGNIPVVYPRREKRR